MHPRVMSIQYRNVMLTSPGKCSQMASLRTKIFLGKHDPRPPYMLGGYHYAAQAVPPPPQFKLVPTPLPLLYTGGRFYTN